jgi:YebC/PmpR family DNA-binding regulatory protein
MIRAMTDNRNRTASEVRAALTRAGASLGTDGSVSWMFDQVGQIVVENDDRDPDEIALLAIDAGATEIEPDEEETVIYSESQELHRMQEALEAAGLTVESAELVMKPKDLITPDPEATVKVIRLVERLEELDDVQNVYTNLDISDAVMADIGAGR